MQCHLFLPGSKVCDCALSPSVDPANRETVILPQDFNQEDEHSLQIRLRKELVEHGGFTKLDIVYGRKPALE